MTLVWVTLFLLHQGHSLVPVVTVQSGQPVTFTCNFTETYQTVTWLHWYKQSGGENMKLIATLRKNTNPNYGPGIIASRYKTTYDSTISKLTIIKTSNEDEGMYHCAHMDWIDSKWTGTYLSIQENSERTSRYNVVQQTPGSDPAHPVYSGELQCSVLSESNNEMWSGDHGAIWFRARSNTSYPDFIYTDGNRAANCDKKRDTERRCRYQFSKNISSSDAGTYLCAVATCGQILFGNRTNIKTDESFEFTLLMVSIICLAISVTVNIAFICYRIRNSASKQLRETRNNDLNQLDHNNTAVGQDLNYAALHFSGGEEPKGKKKRELRTEDSVYSQVKGLL